MKNTMKMKKIILLAICSTALLVAGCGGKETEQRYVCSSFSTPWVYFTYMDDGIIRWRKTKKDNYSKSYKIFLGDLCEKEARILKGN